MKLLYSTLGVLSIALILSACDRPQINPGDDQKTALLNDRDIYISDDDRALLIRVRELVEVQPKLTNAAGVSIEANNAVITLRGVVGSDEDRNAIEEQVKSVPGVQRVVNKLEVAPKEMSHLGSGLSLDWADEEEDMHLTLAIAYGNVTLRDHYTQDSDRDMIAQMRAIIAADPILSRVYNSIAISIDNGNVVLTGTVTSPEQRAQMVNRLMVVGGIQSMSNQLQVY